MNISIAISLCFLPLLALFIIFKLSIKGFSIPLGLISVLCGLLSMIPITCLQYVMASFSVFTQSTMLSLLISSIIVNGLIEEGCKMMFLMVIPSKERFLPTFFSYGLLSGLSLGLFELIIYLLHGELQVGLRFITAVIIHTSCSGLSVLFIWHLRTKHFNILPFVLSILLHGLYDFFSATGFFKSIFSIIAILLTLQECRIWYIKANEREVLRSKIFRL